MASNFFAYASRLRLITRWGLKRTINQEDNMQHSWEVAMVAYTLAAIRQELFGGTVDPHHCANEAASIAYGLNRSSSPHAGLTGSKCLCANCNS